MLLIHQITDLMNNSLICLDLLLLDSFWRSSFPLSAFICSWPPNSVSVPLLSIPLSLYAITVSLISLALLTACITFNTLPLLRVSIATQ